MAKGEILYVVGTIDFQYNDETYYAPEGDAVLPVMAYRTRQSAESALLATSLKAMQEWDLLSFGYDESEVFSDVDAALELYQAAGYDGKDFDDLRGGDSNEIVAKMTPAQQKKLLNLLQIRFAEIREV